MTSIKYSIRAFTCLLLLAVATAGADPADFPKPVELNRDVDFWINIFTIYSTNEGVLHDNRNMSVVYEHMDMPSSVSRRERNRRAQKRRKRYQAILRTLAGGKRDNLNKEEQRVLDLWPHDVGASELTAAVGRIRFVLQRNQRSQECSRHKLGWPACPRMCQACASGLRGTG